VEDENGFLNGKKYLLVDRDTKFTAAFCEMIEREGTECVRLPPRSPNLNAHIERFMRSIKEDCLSRMIFFGDKALRTATSEYLQHYHFERNHQGLKNNVIQPDATVDTGIGTVECRERLGGLLRYYYRKAA
jgi:putative transposase